MGVGVQGQAFQKPKSFSGEKALSANSFDSQPSSTIAVHQALLPDPAPTSMGHVRAKGSYTVAWQTDQLEGQSSQAKVLCCPGELSWPEVMSETATWVLRKLWTAGIDRAAKLSPSDCCPIGPKGPDCRDTAPRTVESRPEPAKSQLW